MTRARLPTAVTLALACAAWPGFPCAVINDRAGSLQAAAQQTRTFRIGVQTVVVYATVSDAGGRPLPDLPVDAFQVFDSGRPVQVTVFSSEPQPVTVALMLDKQQNSIGRQRLVDCPIVAASARSLFASSNR